MCQVSIVSWQTRRAFAIPVQVKTIHGPAWQFNATKLLDIVIKNGNQKVLRRKRTLHPDLVCILVVICGAGKDEFYTLQFKDLQTTSSVIIEVASAERLL